MSNREMREISGFLFAEGRRSPLSIRRYQTTSTRYFKFRYLERYGVLVVEQYIRQHNCMSP
jgi:hypothetical protein